MSETSESDYGPLAPLIGTWVGDHGVDVSPEPDGEAREPYFETLFFEGIGDLDNAEEQDLFALRYHQTVVRKRDSKVFHNQTGFWSWDSASKTVFHSFSIARGLAVVAGGTHDGLVGPDGSVKLAVKASLEHPNWTIVQAPFLMEKAKTTGFEMDVSVKGNQLKYNQTTFLEIYGRTFDHTDNAVLRRMG